MLQRELVPSFLKALYITSEDTIFDDDEVIATQHSLIPLGLKSLTNSAEGALSAPEALKLKMQEMNRSKSALASHSNHQQASHSQLDVMNNLHHQPPAPQPSAPPQQLPTSSSTTSTGKQITFHRAAPGGYFVGDGSQH